MQAGLAGQITNGDPAERTATRRIRWRLLPYLFALFIVSYLDRVNLGYAGLQMTVDTGFSDQVFGLGAGIFFIGYFVLEIPGTILVETWSARRWIARIMITWGLLAAAMAFVHTRTQFYSIRFLLGAAEAGFFPGIIVYLGHWFRKQDRGRAIAMFMAAVPVSNVIGAPLSGLLLDVHWFGVAGWRWLFIVEGVPAVVLGITTIFYLTDRPRQAHWLSEPEQNWIEGELAAERLGITAAGGAPQSSGLISKILHGLRQRDVVFLALAYFFIVTTVYGFNFWLPKILEKLSGFSHLTVAILAAIPYAAGLVAMIIIGSSSDRTGERRWHAAGPMLLAAAGMLLSALTQSSAGLALAMFTLGAAGLYSFFSGFWALPGSLLTGASAAAAIGLINSVGNLGGFVGPVIVGYLKNRTGSFVAGVLYLSFSALLASFCVLATRKQVAEAKSSPG